MLQWRDDPQGLKPDSSLMVSMAPLKPRPFKADPHGRKERQIGS
jgi:hypothetical protein